MDYSRLRFLNKLISNKYERNKNEVVFIDYYLFHLSSFSLSLYREDAVAKSENRERNTLSTLFLVRSIIEDISIIKYYEIEKPENAEKLLKSFWAIKEYNIYKKYTEYDGIIFDLKEMESNYNLVKNEYKKIYDDMELNSREQNKKLNSIIPFLKNGYTLKSFIGDFFPKYKEIYKKISVCIHPISILLNYNEVILDYDELFKNIFTDVESIILKYYPNVESYTKFTFEFEYTQYYYDGNTKNIHVLNFQSQINNINQIKSIIENNLNKTPDYKIHVMFLDKILSIINSISIDRAFGFSEIIKSKFKAFSELCSTYYYLLSKDRESLLSEYNTIINYYTKYNLNILKPNKNDKVFSLYKRIINEVSFEDFNKMLNNELPVYLGFNSIKEFVFTMNKELFKDKSTIGDLLYEESQAFSHGNGYLLSATDGAFNDYKSVIQVIDLLLGLILEYYLENEKIKAKIQNEFKGKHKKNIYDIPKLFNQYYKIINSKWMYDGILTNLGEFI